VKNRSGAPIIYAGFFCALAVLGVTALYYVFSAVPPYGFYYDLGGNISATSHIANWMHGFADVWDSLGWAGWGERTAFTYAPMTVYVFSVPLAKIFGGNAFAAVKAMQVADLAIAWVSGWFLYVVLRGRTPWALVAGLVYALLPEQMLMLRGNMEFGLVSALAPLALACPIALVRRFGLAALPFCGAIAALFTTYIVVEYAIFVGIPAVLIAVCGAYDRTRRLAWFLYSAGAFVAFLAVAAYTAIPTFASHTLFAAPATIDALLQSGEFNAYAEGPIALVALLLNESLANQRPEFSLGPLIWVALPLGGLLWAFAIGWVVRGLRRRAFAPGERALVIGAVVCALIAMGSIVPGVGVVWWLIAHLPGLNMVRTPDRFIALAIPMVVVAAVSTLEYLARTEGRRAPAYGALGAIAAVCFTMFFLLRIFLGDTYSIEERQPHFDTINAVAESRANRLANLALVDQGSIFDTSLYGMMMPGVDFSEDFTQRYEGDGLGGTGMLARANIATVIASPPWTKDSPLLAASAVARAAFLQPLEGDATTVTAFGVEPIRGYVHPVELACIVGGPGMLDYLESLPAFASSAFVPNGNDCARTLYTDSAPAAAVLGGRIVASIPGVTMFPNSGVLRDIDYRIALGRFFLNVPWYRNSIDGDSPQISDGAVSLDSGNSGSASFSIPQAGTYSIALRAVCHGTIHGTLRVDNGPEKPLLCRAAPGFTWTEVPAGALSAGAHHLSVALGDFDTTAAVAQTTWHFGLDGAVAVAMGQAPPAAAQSSLAFAFAASRLESAFQSAVSPSLTLVDAPGFETVPGAAGAHHIQLLARASDAAANYRFDGVPGRYRIAAAAYADASASGGTYLGILDGTRCCAAISTFSKDRGEQIYVEGDRFLRPGDRVTVVLHTTANDAVAVSQLMSVAVEADPKTVTADDSRSHYGALFDYGARSKRINPQVPSGPTPVPGYADLTPFLGQPLWTKPLTFSAAGFPRDTLGSPTAFTAEIAGEGSVEVRLTCGHDVVTARLTAPGGDVTLPQSAAPDCTAVMTTQSAGLYLQRVAITRSIVSLDLRGRRWIAAGSYRVAPIRRGGSVSTGTVVLDGRRVDGIVRVARSGEHDVRWSAAPADAFMLAFIPVSWPQSAPAVSVVQDASQRWSVHVDRPVTLEGAVLWDGNWHLAGRGGSVPGASCDVENTCFASVPPGDYRLWHSWPGYILIGFAITLLAWAVSAGLLVVAARKT
jgi:hypothetical protein